MKVFHTWGSACFPISTATVLGGRRTGLCGWSELRRGRVGGDGGGTGRLSLHKDDGLRRGPVDPDREQGRRDEEEAEKDEEDRPLDGARAATGGGGLGRLFHDIEYGRNAGRKQDAGEFVMIRGEICKKANKTRFFVLNCGKIGGSGARTLPRRVRRERRRSNAKDATGRPDVASHAAVGGYATIRPSGFMVLNHRNRAGRSCRSRASGVRRHIAHAHRGLCVRKRPAARPRRRARPPARGARVAAGGGVVVDSAASEGHEAVRRRPKAEECNENV